MTQLSPLEPLFDETIDDSIDIPMPKELLATYGPLRIRKPLDRLLVVANFVATLDGVVDLNLPDHHGGGHISGFNEHDRFVMGLLRAVADVVVVGSGTFQGAPNHVWTAEQIYPRFKEEFQELRDSMHKQPTPLNVVVTASGRLDFEQRLFTSREASVMIITTEEGALEIRRRAPDASIQIETLGHSGAISAGSILKALRKIFENGLVLIEGGPRLIGGFFAERCLDELFFTLAPQVAGRDSSMARPGLVDGKLFSPHDPIWSTLAGVKRAGSHLLLRYRFS